MEQAALVIRMLLSKSLLMHSVATDTGWLKAV